jgi:hypothetical protein
MRRSKSSTVRGGVLIVATNVRGPRRSVMMRHSVVLPVPISPVMTMIGSRRGRA